MRPHRLLMKAFGPFAKETVVDFDSMGNNIYLISGDTGAGKTTIFDGIIYALYGTASGGARSGLGTEAFHSDYAKDGNHREEMRVELTFSNAGRTYTVTRRMYWGKKGDSRTAAKESVLSENGNTIVFSKGLESKDDVTAKVTEILGLDADQFRRIIMLAQGEFQKFLTAKSDERGTILGKLYDNRRHQDFQLRLKAAQVLLENRQKALIESAKARINMFAFPEETGEEERLAVAVDHPALLPAMEAIIGEIKTRLDVLEKSAKTKEEEIRRLEEQKAKGDINNGLLDELDQKKTQLRILDEKEEEMDVFRKLVGLAAAAEKILPFEAAMIRADKEWVDIRKKIDELEKQKEQLEERAEALKKTARKKEETNAPLITELLRQISARQSILHFYDDLAAGLAEQKRRKEALKEAERHAREAKETLDSLQKQERELTGKLELLDSAGEAAVEIAEQELQKCTLRRDNLKKIQDSVGAVRKLENEEAELKAALQEAGKEELRAEAEHLRLNTAFIAGQAGILAQDMREKLQKEPEVSCPVCGTAHTRADIPFFAEWHADMPDRESVDRAYKEWEKARREKGKAEKAHSEKAGDLSTRKQALLEKTEELLAISDWDILAKGIALSDALRESEQQIARARILRDQAVKDKEAKEKAAEEKTRLGSRIELARKALSEAEENQTGAGKEAAAADTSVENWKLQLQGYPDNKSIVLDKIESLGKEADALQKQIEKAKADYSECLQAQAKNRGELNNAYAERDSREKAKREAEEEFIFRLRKGAFANAEDYHRALSPEGRLLSQEDLENWLEAGKQEIDKYDQSRSSLQSAIKQLTESTRGIERADITAITEQIEKASDELGRMRKSEKNLAADYQTDQKVFKEMRVIRQELGNYQKVSEKLKPLSDTANGRYAFSRYVLRGFFYRIVEQANIHLETMTDGEYCLVPKETGDGRTSMGLGLRVLNTITGLERETASLSGGQLFEASLSLALGLSDIVQMESSSSIQIDSMFIDEGFGSLDGGRLDKSIEVLQHLSAGKRQIGIISHVARLEECLPRKIHVIAGEKGSRVRIETDA